MYSNDGIHMTDDSCSFKFRKRCVKETRINNMKKSIESPIKCISDRWVTIMLFIGLVSSYIGMRVIRDDMLPVHCHPLIQDTMAILTLLFLLFVGISLAGKVFLSVYYSHKTD